MCPPFCFTMPYTVASPSPVPLPSLLGGEERLEQRWLHRSRSMPAPVSRDREHHIRPGLDAGMRARRSRRRARRSPSRCVSRPPCGIASRALTARFIRICSTWPGRRGTEPSVGSIAVSSSMSSPISRAQHRLCTSVTTSFRSITLGCDHLLAAERQQLPRQRGGARPPPCRCRRRSRGRGSIGSSSVRSSSR